MSCGTSGEKPDRQDSGTIRVPRLSEAEPISGGGTPASRRSSKQEIGPPHRKQFFRDTGYLECNLSAVVVLVGGHCTIRSIDDLGNKTVGTRTDHFLITCTMPWSVAVAVSMIHSKDKSSLCDCRVGQLCDGYRHVDDAASRDLV